MAQDTGDIELALAAAVGDDSALVAELRAAFFQSAHALVDALGRAGGEADWRQAAWRLQGLAASFGATDLMKRAAAAGAASPGDQAALRRVAAALRALDDA
jgi:hypothetical protein